MMLRSPPPVRNAYLNLLKSFLGVGLLTFPFAFSIIGLGPAILLLVIVVWLVRVSMVLLLRTVHLIHTKQRGSEQQGERGSTFPEIARRAASIFVHNRRSSFVVLSSSSPSSSLSSSKIITSPNLISSMFIKGMYSLTFWIIVLSQLGTCIGYLTFISSNLLNSGIFYNSESSSSSSSSSSETDGSEDTSSISVDHSKQVHPHHPSHSSSSSGPATLNAALWQTYLLIVCVLCLFSVYFRTIRSMYPISILGMSALCAGIITLASLCSSGGGQSSGDTTSPSLLPPPPPTATTTSFSLFSFSAPDGEPFWAFHPSGVWRFLGIALFAAEGIVSIPSILTSLSASSSGSGSNNGKSIIASSGGSGHTVSSSFSSPTETTGSSTTTTTTMTTTTTHRNKSPPQTPNTVTSTLATAISVTAPTAAAAKNVRRTTTETVTSSPAAKMLMVLDAALLTTTCFLLAGGVGGWICLGPSPPSIVTAALPLTGSTAASFTRICFSMYILCTYPLQLFPVVEAVEPIIVRIWQHGVMKMITMGGGRRRRNNNNGSSSSSSNNSIGRLHDDDSDTETEDDKNKNNSNNPDDDDDDDDDGYVTDTDQRRNLLKQQPTTTTTTTTPPTVLTLASFFSSTSPSSYSSPEWIIGTLCRIFLILFTMVIASYYMSSFSLVISFIGWLAFGVLSFLVPPIAYLCMIFSSYTTEELDKGLHTREWERQVSLAKKNIMNDVVAAAITKEVEVEGGEEDDEDDQEEGKRLPQRGGFFCKRVLFSWKVERALLFLYVVGGLLLSIAGLIGVVREATDESPGHGHG